MMSLWEWSSKQRAEHQRKRQWGSLVIRFWTGLNENKLQLRFFSLLWEYVDYLLLGFQFEDWCGFVLGGEFAEILKELSIKEKKKGDWCLSFIFTLPLCCTEVLCQVLPLKIVRSYPGYCRDMEGSL